MISQSLDHNPQMLHMLLSTPRIHKDAIDGHNQLGIQKRPEHIIHQIHEHCWGIGQPKRCHLELIMAIMSPKGYLWDFLSPNPQLMVTVPQVNLREHCHSLKLVK